MFKKKKIVAIIQVRMSSTRLPGKALLPLGGKPALEQLITRLRRSAHLDAIVVATTTLAADQPIRRLCRRHKIQCFSGSEDDVLDRVHKAARWVGADIIVEITADCPLIDGPLVDRGIKEFFSHDVDYASNCLVPSYPLGFEVQVFPVAVLAKVADMTRDPVDRLHVSYYMYQHPEIFRLHNWRAELENTWPQLRLTLDEPADYELIRRIFDALGDTDFGTREIVAFVRKNPELAKINQHVRQKNAQEG